MGEVPTLRGCFWGLFPTVAIVGMGSRGFMVAGLIQARLAIQRAGC